MITLIVNILNAIEANKATPQKTKDKIIHLYKRLNKCDIENSAQKNQCQFKQIRFLMYIMHHTLSFCSAHTHVWIYENGNRLSSLLS